ncbi:MAG: PDZ domain-containing protein [Proteobacteria bacterium]|nr:PDZ domain-containing protein [Pseudomonadota bacterium]
MPFVQYNVSMEEAHAHLFNVTCQINAPSPEKQIISLPAWIPGSYLIRDFSKNIIRIKVFCADAEIPIQKIDKDSWSIPTNGEPITIFYQVYARDRSVRTAYLDQFRGFINGTSLFLQIHGLEHTQHKVDISRPSWLPTHKKWSVSTAMIPNRIDRLGFGRYVNESYESLIDHPLEIGESIKSSFFVKNVPHNVVITGNPRANIRRICQDLKLIVETQVEFWGAIPVDRYTFLINAVNDDYGGLEHSHSTALICSKTDLPTDSDSPIADGYLKFLGLCSHEYFHLWNIKRLKPAVFSPYDLTKENYTELLWAFEGITSYYDDLMLYRAGLVDERRYLSLLAKTITAVKKTNGRSKQTLAESSFYAWTKFYKQDENGINSIVSYYSKGSLAALCLDLHLRKKTDGRTSLDTVMRALWNTYGKKNKGVPENGIETTAALVSGLDLRDFFHRIIRSTRELPIKPLLNSVGVQLTFTTPNGPSDSGDAVNTSVDKNRQAIKHDLGFTHSNTADGLRIKQVFDNGAAQHAGIAPGDVIMAINRQRPSINNMQQIIDLEKKNSVIPIHVFRDDVLHTVQFPLLSAPKNIAYLYLDPLKNKLLHNWLNRKVKSR